MRRGGRAMFMVMVMVMGLGVPVLMPVVVLVDLRRAVHGKVL